MPIITLTTDFGNDDPFDGVMKGVILNICPQATIIDLTHNISPQDIYQANFLLDSCYQYFPRKTIHVCVVDPGVGSLRKPILIETKNYFFIGPDNGLFTAISEKENVKNVYELTERKYWLKKVSQTFHGRDIFAPVAAYLAKGIKPKQFGRKIQNESLVKLLTNKPAVKTTKLGVSGYKGIIQYIDHFGNLITNIPNEKLPSTVSGKFKEISFKGPVLSFAKAIPEKLTAIKGSSGYMELFIFKGNAAKFTHANVGNTIEVTFK